MFGPGNVEDVHVGDCNDGMVGYQKATCKSTGQWQITDNNCVLQEIQNLKDRVAVIIFYFEFNFQECIKKIF